MLPRSRSYVDVDKVLDDLTTLDHSDEKIIREFEETFAQYIGAPHCYATNQGRAALLIALKSLDLNNDDEVIVQSFTYQGVIDAIIETGAKTVLADNSIPNLNANSSEIVKKITDNTRVIIATHLFGVPCDIGMLAKIAKEHDIYLFEDCAQCLGARYNGKYVGTFGDISFTSFNYEKHLTTGEGGMLVVNNNEFNENVVNTLNKYQKIPLNREKEYVYGLLINDVAFSRDHYQKRLSAYYGQNLCKESKRLVPFIDEIIQQNVSKDQFHQIMLPQIRKYDAIARFKRTMLRNRYNLVYRLYIHLFDHDYPKIDNDYLLMNTPRAIVGLQGLKKINEVNNVRNSNAHQLMDALRECKSYTSPEIEENYDPAFLKINLLNNSDYSLQQISQKAHEKGWELGNFQWVEPVHAIQRYQNLIPPNQRENLMFSEYIASHILNIPVHYDVKTEDIEGIVALLMNFAK